MYLNIELLEKISKMFDFSNELFNKFKDVKIVNGHIQKETIRDIMREDGFLLSINFTFCFVYCFVSLSSKFLLLLLLFIYI